MEVAIISWLHAGPNHNLTAPCVYVVIFSIHGVECEGVVHVFPAYSLCREGFRQSSQELLGDSFE